MSDEKKQDKRKERQIEEARQKALQQDIDRIVRMLDEFAASEGARMKLKVTEDISPGEVKKDYYITGAGVPTENNPLKEKKKLNYKVTLIWNQDRK